MRPVLLLPAALASVLASCASVTSEVRGTNSALICGSGAQSYVCLGTVKVPLEFMPAVRSGGAAAIDMLASSAFHHQLHRFAAFEARRGKIDAWRTFDPDAAILATRGAVGNVSIATFGGLYGWWVRTFSGTVAKEGNQGGPILFNRVGMSRQPSELANTIIHEAARRAGFSHPHSDLGNWQVAYCEPPYVIGSLVERLVVHDRSPPTLLECSDLNRAWEN